MGTSMTNPEAERELLQLLGLGNISNPNQADVEAARMLMCDVLGVPFEMPDDKLVQVARSRGYKPPKPKNYASAAMPTQQQQAPGFEEEDKAIDVPQHKGAADPNELAQIGRKTQSGLAARSTQTGMQSLSARSTQSGIKPLHARKAESETVNEEDAGQERSAKEDNPSGRQTIAGARNLQAAMDTQKPKGPVSGILAGFKKLLGR